jgi:hypothetical protein
MVDVFIVIISNSLFNAIMLKFILDFNKKCQHKFILTHILPLIHSDLSEGWGCYDFDETFEPGSEDS